MKVGVVVEGGKGEGGLCGVCVHVVSSLLEGKFEKLGQKRLKGRDSLYALPTFLCLLVLVDPNQRTRTFARKDSVI